MKSISQYPGGRRKDPTYSQLNLNLTPELIKKLRIIAIQKGFNLSELAEEIFNTSIEEKK